MNVAGGFWRGILRVKVERIRPCRAGKEYATHA